MKHFTCPIAIKRRRVGGPVLLGWLVLSVAISAWTGCAPEKNYKVLSFFFDGVPDPNAVITHYAPTDAEHTGPTTGPLARGSIHKPYAEQQCSECHGDAKAFEEFTKIPATVCMKCHEKVPTQYAVMHGPVASVECNWCHTPHESPHRSLLKFVSPDVCAQCHESTLLPSQIPEHLDPAKDCLQCHTGHGSDKHGMLRPIIALKNPTTAPTTAPMAPPTTGVVE